MKLINFKRLENLFFGTILKYNHIVLHYDNRQQKVRMPTTRPLAMPAIIGGAGANLVNSKPNTSVSFEDIVCDVVSTSKIYAALIRYFLRITQLCNQKRRFSIHCSFVIT